MVPDSDEDLFGSPTERVEWEEKAPARRFHVSNASACRSAVVGLNHTLGWQLRDSPDAWEQ